MTDPALERIYDRMASAAVKRAKALPTPEDVFAAKQAEKQAAKVKPPRIPKMVCSHGSRWHKCNPCRKAYQRERRKHAND